ncbi:hypothetical protein DMN91_001895, partial [Ooceraea biroi]
IEEKSNLRRSVIAREEQDNCEAVTFIIGKMFHGTWHWWSVLLLLLLATRLLSVYSQCGSYTRQERQENQDEQSKLALYKVSLRTYWSRARFPRHYPEWKPPAQFGKLFGRTHDSSYILYRLSEKLSPGAQLYVETGRVDELDTDGDPNILHSFIGAPVLRGEGTSVTRVFLDSNHTLISIMARINPSPDWFVGVDSFQLCVDGNWVDTVTVEIEVKLIDCLRKFIVNLLHRKQYVEIGFDDSKVMIVMFTTNTSQVTRKSSKMNNCKFFINLRLSNLVLMMIGSY